MYIFWDWHPNAEGHRVAAQAIETFVRPVVAQWMVGDSITHSSERRRTAAHQPKQAGKGTGGGHGELVGQPAEGLVPR